jgi:hypothetical protein
MPEIEKYPRTYHFPFSEGAVNDDRIQYDWERLLSHELVITEKLDGENTCIKTSGVYARSHGATNRNPWAKPVWDIWERIGRTLGDLHLFGENLYAIHSIQYERLDHHFFIFGIRENDTWLSWEAVCEYAYILDLPVAPLVSSGVFSIQEMQTIIQQKQLHGSALGGISEGVVARRAAAFPDADFPEAVLKYVRKNHVQTDEHWIRNWKRAPLWMENPHQ